MHPTIVDGFVSQPRGGLSKRLRLAACRDFESRKPRQHNRACRSLLLFVCLLSSYPTLLRQFLVNSSASYTCLPRLITRPHSCVLVCSRGRSMTSYRLPYDYHHKLVAGQAQCYECAPTGLGVLVVPVFDEPRGPTFHPNLRSYPHSPQNLCFAKG